MNRFISMALALLWCGVTAFGQYTNVLEGGAEQTVDSAWTNGMIQVGGTTSSNTLSIINGGLVASTNVFIGSTNGANANAVSVTDSGRLDVENTLFIGTGTNNAVSVGSGGAIVAGDLVLNADNSFNLNGDGTFSVATDFDASASGFNWNEGGHLSVAGELSGMTVSNGNSILDGGRDLTLDGGTWDTGGTNLIVGFGSSGSDLQINDGGLMRSGTAYIGWSTNAANNAISVGGGSVWTNSGDLWVGYEGSANTVSIFNGGTNVIGQSAHIGYGDAAENLIQVTGTNSLLQITDALVVGSGATNSVDNMLEVSDAAMVRVGGDLTLNASNSIYLAAGGEIGIGGSMGVYSNAAVIGEGTLGFGANDTVLAFSGMGIEIDPGIVFSANPAYNNTVSVNDGLFTVSGSNAQQYVNFQTLETTDSGIAGYGVLDAFSSVDMSGGFIDPISPWSYAAHLEVPGNFSSSGAVYRAQVYETVWDQLVFSGANPVDLSGLGVDVFVPFAPTGGVATILISDGGLVNGLASTNVIERLLLYNADLVVNNNEITVVVTPDNGSLSSSLGYAATESVRAGFGGMKNLVFTRTKQLRRNLVATSGSVPFETYLLSTNTPTGAMGPGDQNTIFDMHVWVQHYSGQGDYSASGISDAFTLNNNGTSIGADRFIGDALAVGFNYTYARSAARADNDDQLDAETYWLGLYGEWVGLEGLYVDALAGYGYSTYNTLRVAENYLGRAEFNGLTLGASVDVGQYYHAGNVALAPYLGLNALTSMTEDYTETEASGSMVKIDEADRSWFESAIGMKLRHRFDTGIGRFQTTGYAEWTYDFIQDEVYSSISSSGLAATRTAPIVPDDSGINAGIGYSWICTDYMELGIGYNGRFSDSYEEHTGTLMLDLMF